MRILVLSLPDLRKIYPQRPHHLLKHLSKKHEVTVLSVNAWWLKEKQDEYLNECLKNVEILYPSKQKIHPILQEISIIKKYLFDDTNIGTFDVLLSLNDLIAAHFLSKREKIPMVFDICDDIPKYIGSSPQIPRLLRPFGEFFGKIMLKKNIKLSKRITYTIESLRKIYNMPQNKSLLIPNGVDTELFYCDPQHFKEEFSISEDDFIIGFIGFLGEWVDLESPLISLKKLIKDNFKVKMLIVGDGNKLTHVENIVKRLNISGSVIFTGSVPYTKVPKYISCMDVCLLPFKKDAVSENALPLKLFEYMACEKPVISAKLPGVVDAVHDKVLYASNKEEFTDKIIKLYKDEKLRRKMGQEGRKFVEEGYSWSKIALKFEKVLLEVVS